jgi:hypothetical protein
MEEHILWTITQELQLGLIRGDLTILRMRMTFNP